MASQLSNRWTLNLSAIAVIGTVFCPTALLPVSAATLVTQRTDLQANDQLDWSNLDVGIPVDTGAGQPFNFLPNSFEANSANGLEIGVDILVAGARFTPPFVFQVSPSLPVNFENGDSILFTGFIPGEFPAVGNPGPITITFNTPVSGAGTQLAVDDTLNFTAFVSAFDSNNNRLGSFSIPGTSATVIDNSAVFLGVSSDSNNISKLIFSSSEPNRAFGINSLSIRNVAVNESISPLVFGVLGLGFLGMKKKVWSSDRH